MQRQRPSDWGDDTLSEFLDTFAGNMIASFVQLKPMVSRLGLVDDAFVLACGGHWEPSNSDAAVFLPRARSAFLGACALATAGQVVETQMVLRGCLEAAVYGHFLNSHPEHAAAWVNRSDSPEARAKARGVFRFGTMVSELQQANRQLGDRVRGLYERSIDFGAHPNEASIRPNLLISHGEGRTDLRLAILQVGNVPHLWALQMCGKVGLAALDVFCLCCPALLSDETIRRALESARQAVWNDKHDVADG